MSNIVKNCSYAVNNKIIIIKFLLSYAILNKKSKES